MCCRLWNKETFWRDWAKKNTRIWRYRALRGPGAAGICLPRGHPLACDTHVVSYPNIQADWHISSSIKDAKYTCRGF